MAPPANGETIGVGTFFDLGISPRSGIYVLRTIFEAGSNEARSHQMAYGIRTPRRKIAAAPARSEKEDRSPEFVV
jgi:hypothetical protein